MNSFNLTLSGEHLICPSILNDSFAGYSNLGWRSLPFMTLNASFQPLLACKFLLRNQLIALWELLCRYLSPFVIFKILSLSVILGNVIMMCIGVCFLGSNFFGTLSFLDFLKVYFLCQIGEVLLHYLFK